MTKRQHTRRLARLQKAMLRGGIHASLSFIEQLLTHYDVAPRLRDIDCGAVMRLKEAKP